MVLVLRVAATRAWLSWSATWVGQARAEAVDDAGDRVPAAGDAHDGHAHGQERHGGQEGAVGELARRAGDVVAPQPVEGPGRHRRRAPRTAWEVREGTIGGLPASERRGKGAARRTTPVRGAWNPPPGLPGRGVLAVRARGKMPGAGPSHLSFIGQARRSAALGHSARRSRELRSLDLEVERRGGPSPRARGRQDRLRDTGRHEDRIRRCGADGLGHGAQPGRGRPRGAPVRPHAGRGGRAARDARAAA